MKSISSLLIGFCAALILIGALYMLCPDGAMKKSTKFVLSLVFLLSVISLAGVTLDHSDFDFDVIIPKTTETASLDSETAKFVFSYALQKSGIDFQEITVCTTKLSDGSIVISKVIIESYCEREKIIEALGEAAKNFEVEVINE